MHAWFMDFMDGRQIPALEGLCLQIGINQHELVFKSATEGLVVSLLMQTSLLPHQPGSVIIFMAGTGMESRMSLASAASAESIRKPPKNARL